MTKLSTLSLITVLTLGSFALVGCEDNNMEDAADSLGDAVENTSDHIGDAVEDAADSVEDATN
jgi:predicted small secreted protein